MSITILVQHRYTIRPASTADCKQFHKPNGTWEVLDNDSMRICWAASEQDAVDKIADLVYADINHMDFELIKEHHDVSE